VEILGDYLGAAHYTAISDMNRDGRPDFILAGDLKENGIVCYESPLNPIDLKAWKKHILYLNRSHRTYHVETGDIDGDNFPDVVFTTKTDNGLAWLRNPGQFGNEWESRWIDLNCIRCFYARVQDTDSDGRAEIWATSDDYHLGGKIFRYVHNTYLKNSQNFSKEIVAVFPPGHGVSVFKFCDINFDGYFDIVAGNHQGDIYLVQNPGLTPKSDWKISLINDPKKRSTIDLREIDCGDIDMDGDIDIIVADEVKNMVVWYENHSESLLSYWTEHIIDQSDIYLKFCHSVALADIDGDGYLDALVASAAGNTFLVYFSNLKESVRSLSN
jgi:hypothetical protein